MTDGYYYKPTKYSCNLTKIFYDYDEDAQYRLNFKGKTNYTLAEIVELNETHLIKRLSK